MLAKVVRAVLCELPLLPLQLGFSPEQPPVERGVLALERVHPAAQLTSIHPVQNYLLEDVKNVARLRHVVVVHDVDQEPRVVDLADELDSVFVFGGIAVAAAAAAAGSLVGRWRGLTHLIVACLVASVHRRPLREPQLERLVLPHPETLRVHHRWLDDLSPGENAPRHRVHSVQLPARLELLLGQLVRKARLAHSHPAALGVAVSALTVRSGPFVVGVQELLAGAVGRVVRQPRAELVALHARTQLVPNLG
mmetsp:Transcript_20308/g.64875  ORF Transcript_20308/g.64875 Transcript_20308/m.64875 type:complete len:251 (-) Transcript_20308:1499-2251(-)